MNKRIRKKHRKKYGYFAALFSRYEKFYGRLESPIKIAKGAMFWANQIVSNDIHFPIQIRPWGRFNGKM